MALIACQCSLEPGPLRAATVGAPAHCRWSSYRTNGLGQSDQRLIPRAGHSGLTSHEDNRQEPTAVALRDMRLAFEKGQPARDSSRIDRIERAGGSDANRALAVGHERRQTKREHRGTCCRWKFAPSEPAN